ncbi:MAG TPA: hypothetical protein VGH87_17415, partial [Polyangiaceae bacterium]
PTLLDFSAPEMVAKQITADKVMAGIRAEGQRIRALGYDLDQCLIDLGETAEAKVLEHLRAKKWDCVLVGAGVRTNPNHLHLFEKVLNLVHEHAPSAHICFSTSPNDSVDAIKRWT